MAKPLADNSPGHIDAEPAKLQIAEKLIEAIEALNITQASTATLLGIDQPKVSRLLRRKLSTFSASRLLHFLTLIGQDVEIVIQPTCEQQDQRSGHLRITATHQTDKH